MKKEMSFELVDRQPYNSVTSFVYPYKVYKLYIGITIGTAWKKNIQKCRSKNISFDIFLKRKLL